MTAKKAAAKKAADSGAKKIVRQDSGAWWCPVCDHSNSLLQPHCGGCGAVRDGDTVKARS